MSETANSAALARHSLIYLAGSAIALLGGILMLPVYTRHLSPAEYGLLETLLRFVGICMALAFAGLRQGYQRFYFDHDEVKWRQVVTATTIIGIGLVAFFIVLPLLLLASQLAPLFGMVQLTFSRSVILGVWLAFEACYTVGLSSLQVRFLSSAYAVTQSFRVALLLGLNYVFLNVFHLGLVGALAGNVVAAIATGGIAIVLLLRWSGVRVSKPTLRSMLSFGAPYIPTAVFAYVIFNADRFALLQFGYAATLGLLSLAAKLGEMALSLLVTPIENVWGPFALSVRDHKDGPQKIGQLYVRYIAFSLLVGVTISLGAPLAILVLASAQYEHAADLVPLVVMSCICYNVACLSDLGIQITKRSSLKPVLYGSGAGMAVALQLLLTPRFGLVGAVAATALTSLFQLLLTHYVASRQYRFVVDAQALLVLVTGAGIALVAGRALQSYDSAIWVRLAAIGSGVAIMLAAVVASKVFGWRDLKDPRKLFRQNDSVSDQPPA